MSNFECQRCGECCKRYYIISLPHEVLRQAKHKGLTREEFIQKHMQLFLQFFPAEHSKEKIMVSSSLVPKEIATKLEGHLGKMPDFLIALPMLVFRRRENGSCTFYDEKNRACTIYQERPLECRLFPFISDKKAQDYAGLYPFCAGLQKAGAEVSFVDKSKAHFDEVSEYFREVQKNGFSKIWGSWPKEGVCLFTDKLVGHISESEFFGTIGPYK